MSQLPDGSGLIALALLGLILIFSITMRLNAIHRRFAALDRIEAKLDLLLKQANIRFDPAAGVSNAVIEALRAGRKIEAIRLYRETSGVGLKEAKDFVEGVQRRAGL
jgi:ribosomal protein L7/L12